MSTPILLAAGDWRLWDQFALRGPGFPAAGVLGLAPVGLAEAADKFGSDVVLAGPDWLAFQEVFDQASVATAVRLQEVAALPAFQVALAWQNPKLLRTAVASFLGWTPSVAGRTSMPRQREELVAHYWQRFCVKNDTIGFFGPVGWGRWDRSVAGVVLEPGAGLVASTEVYFSSWSVDAVARVICADARLQRFVPPRRVPFVRVVGDRVSVPGRPAVVVSSLLAAVLVACDGHRLPAEIQAGLPAEHGGVDIDEVLRQLLEHRWITWRMEIPVSAHPERELRAILERVPDEAVRGEALAKLSVLEHGRDRVRAALADPDELVVAMTELESRFSELTEGPAQREKGSRTALCRSLVYSDSRRSATARIGPAVLDQLLPLEFCLSSARWMTNRFADVMREHLRTVYQRLVERDGVVDLGSMWMACMPAPHPAAEHEASLIQAELRKRWSAIIGAPAGARRVYLRGSEIADQVREAFYEPGRGWNMARYISPDLIIVAPDADAVERGDFELVIGELHVATNTIDASLFVMQHPDQDSLLDETSVDFTGPRLIPQPPKEMPGRWSTRSRPALVRPTDYLVGLVDYTADPRRPRTVMSADALVGDADGQLVVTLPDGARFDLLDVFANALTHKLMDRFTLRADGDHSPRVTIDKVVVAREAWQFRASALEFTAEKSEAKRFVKARQWQVAHELPRYVFVVSPTEPRPFYVDFDSPVYVNIFAKAARRLALKDPEAKLRITEMLPNPEQIWLGDDQGQKYTSELRLIAVDQTTQNGSALDMPAAPAVLSRNPTQR